MVYLIDDDDIQNLINSKIIELVDADVESNVFEGGESALNSLRNNDEELPNVIFLDINMPRMSGWDFMEEYVKLDLNIPVYIVTSSINKQDKEKSETYSDVKGFISKPLTKERVVEIFADIYK